MIFYPRATVQIAPIWKNSIRSLTFRKLKNNIYNHFAPVERKPPYYHICQVGDPVLRAKCELIEPEVISSRPFQKLLNQMVSVMNRFNAAGLSAPQIGLPWQIFMIQVTEYNLKDVDPKIVECQEMEPIPLKICINPELKIIDYTQLAFSESCCSVHGYTAVVPRAKEVEISAVDRFGKPFTWTAKGWAARVAQHEYDHLQGQIYIDKMDVSTFSSTIWEQVNRYSGRIELAFLPQESG